MKTLYNAAGEAKTMDFVDAREHLETGRWFESAPVVDEIVGDGSGESLPEIADVPVEAEAPAVNAPRRGRPAKSQ
jgi:hypothetical protein